MSTIREIARELNLSHTTVSRVLNTRNDQAISRATRDRVWEAARSMGYRPHVAARALATGRTQQVGLLMHYLYTAFHAQVVHEVEQTLRRSGYQVIVATVDWYGDTADSENILHAPWQVDGYLAFETASHVNSLLSGARSAGGKSIPLVAMGGHNLSDDTDCAGFDLAAGADMALEHLLGLGRRRIAYVTAQGRDPRSFKYQAVMRAAGLPEEIIMVPSQQRADAREGVRSYFSQIPPASRPDALFCFNDEIAIGAYRALRDLKIGVGDQVLVVGFDGIEDVEYLDTPLTTVALPVKEMCRLAWEMLQARLGDPDAPPARAMLRPSLVVRESTESKLLESPDRDHA